MLLAHRPTTNLEDHPLLAVRVCLFNIFAVPPQMEATPSILNPKTRHAVVTETHIHGVSEKEEISNIRIWNKK